MTEKKEKEKPTKKKRASFTPLAKKKAEAASAELKEAKAAVVKETVESKEPKEEKAADTVEELASTEQLKDIPPVEIVEGPQGPMMVVESASDTAVSKEEPKEDLAASNAASDEPKEAASVKDSGEPKQKTENSVADFAPVDARDTTDIGAMEKSSKKHIIVLIIIAIFSFIFGFIVAVGVGKLVTISGMSVGSKPNATALPEAASTPEPTPTVDRAKVVFEVLNGSGTKGVAAKAAETLTKLGYTVSKTGNAKTSDYEESVLIVTKDTDEKMIALIKSDLANSYPIASVSADLEKVASTTARLIVGKK